MIENPIYSTVLASSHPFPHLPPTGTNTEESSEIRCICGYTHDDGFTIACDQCDTWQHGFCVGIDRNSVPDQYECPECLPRPLDVRRAKDYQTQKKDREEKARRKKPKTGASGASSRKKEQQNHALQNGHHGMHPTAEKHGNGKPTTPKEGHNSRKKGSSRSHAASHSTAASYFPEATAVVQAHGGYPLPNGAPSPALTVATDRNLDADSDTDMERFTKTRNFDFTDITDGNDHYSGASVQRLVNSMITGSKDASLRRVNSNDILPFTLPEISICSVPSNGNDYPLSSYYLTIDVPCPRGQLLAICKGVILAKDAYKTDAINQYALLRHPKPYVFFHPSQPFCIDARIRGTPARFVGRSCHPNTTLATVVVDNSRVLFGLFAVEPLKAKTPLTIEWDWGGCPAMQKIVRGVEPEQLDADEFEDALSWVNYLISQFGECSCSEKEECIISRVRVKRESMTPKPFSGNPRSRQGSRPYQDVFPTPVSDNASPVGPTSPDRDGSVRSSKSRSRDLSPTTFVHHEEISNREAKKMQDIVSRIERIEQGECQPVKRRKRSQNSISNGDTASKATDGGRKSKNSSVSTSSPPPQAKGTTINSVSISPAVNAGAAKTIDLPVIKRIKKPEYVDCSIQTDECEDDWWNPPRKQVMRPQLSLKERLMRRMLREREEAALNAAECKKRKHSEITDSGAGLQEICKEQKLTKESDVKIDGSKVQQALFSTGENTLQANGLGSPTEAAAQSLDITARRETSPVALPTAHNPAPPLANTPANPPLQSQEKSAEAAQPNSLAGKLSVSSTGRSYGLHVQLPPVPCFPSGSASASPAPRTATSPILPATPGSILQSPVANTPNFPSSNGTTAVPAKGKKMSLSEYGKRRGRGEHTADRERKTALLAATDEVMAGVNGVGVD